MTLENNMKTPDELENNQNVAYPILTSIAWIWMFTTT